MKRRQWGVRPHIFFPTCSFYQQFLLENRELFKFGNFHRNIYRIYYLETRNMTGYINPFASLGSNSYNSTEVQGRIQRTSRRRLLTNFRE